MRWVIAVRLQKRIGEEGSRLFEAVWGERLYMEHLVYGDD